LAEFASTLYSFQSEGLTSQFWFGRYPKVSAECGPLMLPATTNHNVQAYRISQLGYHQFSIHFSCWHGLDGSSIQSWASRLGWPSKLWKHS